VIHLRPAALAGVNVSRCAQCTNRKMTRTKRSSALAPHQWLYLNPRLPPPPLLRELLRLLERLELDRRLLELLLRADPLLKRVALRPDELRTALFIASMEELPSPAAAFSVRLRLRLAKLRLAPIWRDLPLNDQSVDRLLSGDGAPSTLKVSLTGAGRQDSVGAKGDDPPSEDALGVLVMITGRVHIGICACNRSASRSTTSCTSSATA
jgi:hypothetical protein